MSEYKVDLDVYNGPLDLLLFLIKREEVDIHDIPIARITAQYIAYVDLLRELDPELVSEFLVLAATLMEIKSRMLLPRAPEEELEDEDIADPRLQLVRQLLEYKKYKDAARTLESAADEWAMRFPRTPASMPREPDEMELDNLDIWNLFDAFKGVLEQIGKAGFVHSVQADDTPIALHAEDVVDSVQRAGGTQKFTEIFRGRTRGETIGLFLALLELMKQKRIRVSQDDPFADILIHLVDARPLDEPVDDDEELGPLEIPGQERDQVEVSEPEADADGAPADHDGRTAEPDEDENHPQDQADEPIAADIEENKDVAQ